MDTAQKSDQNTSVCVLWDGLVQTVIFATTVITILVKIMVDASIKTVVSRVVVTQDGWVGPVLLLIIVLNNPVKIMPLVQIMDIHTRANVDMDGLEQNVNLKISVQITHVGRNFAEIPL